MIDYTESLSHSDSSWITSGLYQISFAGHYEQDWTFLEEIMNVNIERRIQNDKSKSSVARFQGREKLRLFAEFIYPYMFFDFGLKRKFYKLSEAF